MKLIPDELVLALQRYLVQRPYQEVAQAITALSQLAEAPAAPVVKMVPDEPGQQQV